MRSPVKHARPRLLTPGRYVGTEAQEDDGEPFEEKIQRLTAQLEEWYRKSGQLEKRIRANSRGMGHEIRRR